MKKKSLSKLILKLSEGLVARAIDIVLIGIFYFIETAPYTSGSLPQKLSRVERDLQSVNYETLRQAALRAKEKGWLSQDLKITARGKKRLESILPQFENPKKWDGSWYIVTYDIPESKKKLREILRENLKKLGFGELQKSVWVCPYNFLGEVEKIVKEYNLLSYVILAISDKLGREPSKVLANRIWNLEKLNEGYSKFVKEANSKRISRTKIIFSFLFILKKDPQLPKELLPSDWQGKKAYKIYRRIYKVNRGR